MIDVDRIRRIIVTANSTVSLVAHHSSAVTTHDVPINIAIGANAWYDVCWLVATNMNLKEWNATTQRWRELYGKPGQLARDYDPANIRLQCVKCNKLRQKMHRHHKGNDFFFALWMPQVYAGRYIEFRSEDCVKLCDRCHRNIERYSAKLKSELYVAFNILRFNNDPLTVEWCELWRWKFITLYEKWIKKPVRKRNHSRLTAKSETNVKGTRHKRRGGSR